MSNLLLIALNTLKITFRKKSFFVLLLMPIAMVILAIFVNGNVSKGNIKIGVYNKENSYITKDMVANIDKNEKFKVIVFKDEKELKNKISEGKLTCGFIIPNDFSSKLCKGKMENIDILSLKGEDSTIWIKNYLNYYIDNLVDINKISKGNKEIFIKVYNEYKRKNIKLEVNKVKDEISGKNITTQSTGFLVLFMLMGASSISALILADKRRRTYSRIITAPVNAKKYLASNALASLFIMAIQCLIVVISMDKIFKVKTYMPNYQLFILLMCFGLVATGFGMLIVAFSETTYQASNLSTLLITPTCMLSGCFWPMSIMPDVFKKLSNAFPQRWLIKAIETVQSEQNFKSGIKYIFVLLLFALVFFLISAFKFKSKNNSTKFI
ncbi:ABC transporter permease [Haloimpatiens sp. FM7315]|uniref:ABC transporter permease n=1 Tax=Haloimpatiens sp. FM7315 TaxID=3298609 RepID=UPI0035A31551